MALAAALEVGDPITFMDLDQPITFMKVIVTFYPLLWIRLLFSFTAIWAEWLQVQVYTAHQVLLTGACAFKNHRV